MKEPFHAKHELDDLPVNMIRPNLENIPEVPFPEGFTIRTMQSGEASLWTDIQRDAEPFFAIGDDLFQLEYGSDLRATGQRVFFVINGGSHEHSL